MFLLDTNVVSELRRARPHRAVLDWVKSTRNEDLHVSAMTIGEIQAGIEITRDQDENKAAEIEAWLERVCETYNVLSMDANTFRCWARLIHGKSDQLLEDAMIAATAMVHRLTIVTRNIRDFESFRIKTLNPFHSPSR